MLEILAGPVTLGLSRGDRSAFGWDNEYEAHRVIVPAFAIDEYKVSNGQYLEFIAAGGYENHAVWTEDDWKWRTQNDIRHPAFWKRIGNRWHLRAMFDEVPLPLEWPVYVSHAEASAFARWAGKSLPTEAQWQRAAYGTPHGSERVYPWGTEAPDRTVGNFDFQNWDPAPLSAFPENRSAFGVCGMLGNGWEWTASVFGPFDGFEPFEFYPGYSANFFDCGHYVAKGGSARTAACLLRRSFRNWFQPRYPYVYGGFRCASQ
jgi:ergothioneine biosynthesis protein EgtB